MIPSRVCTGSCAGAENGAVETQSAVQINVQTREIRLCIRGFFLKESRALTRSVFCANSVASKVERSPQRLVNSESLREQARWQSDCSLAACLICRFEHSFFIAFGEGDRPHGRGVERGANVGNGVAVGAGVAVAVGLGVVTCACAPVKKDTRPIRTHPVTKANTEVIRALTIGCRS
jgi:hypothetical protein